MTGITAYALSKKIALGAVSGISDISLENGQLKFQFNNGSFASMAIPLPSDGISVTNIKILNGHLICSLSNGTIIDAGEMLNTVQFYQTLPQVGIENILYIVNNKLYTWDGTEYTELSSSSSNTISWQDF